MSNCSIVHNTGVEEFDNGTAIQLNSSALNMTFLSNGSIINAETEWNITGKISIILLVSGIMIVGSPSLILYSIIVNNDTFSQPFFYIYFHLI